MIHQYNKVTSIWLNGVEYPVEGSVLDRLNELPPIETRPRLTSPFQFEMKVEPVEFTIEPDWQGLRSLFPSVPFERDTFSGGINLSARERNLSKVAAQ